MKTKGRFGSLTDIGLVRPSNEDKSLSIIDSQGNVLLCVCDGMGGYMKGDYASKIAADIISKSYKNKSNFIFGFQVKNWIKRTIKSINSTVYNESTNSEKYQGMGTTLCMAILFRNKIYIVNIGDSRCYRLDEDKITQLTRDQSVVEHLASTHQIKDEQKLISKERHLLMNYVGMNKNLNYVLQVFKNERKTILLCSDGLYNNATSKQIFSALNSTERFDQKINTLVGIANSNGGTDNIAVSLWEPNKHD